MIDDSASRLYNSFMELLAKTVPQAVSVSLALALYPGGVGEALFMLFLRAIVAPHPATLALSIQATRADANERVTTLFTSRGFSAPKKMIFCTNSIADETGRIDLQRFSSLKNCD